MDRRPTRLPVSALPREWEPLDGFVQRVARAVDCAPGVLLRHIGLNPLRVRPLRPLLDELHPDAASRIAYACGLTPVQVLAMTDERFAGAIFRNSLGALLGRSTDLRSLGCWQCAVEGWWDLRWSTTAVTVCERHGVYLAWLCPVCGGRFAPRDLIAPRAGEPPGRHGTIKAPCDALIGIAGEPASDEDFAVTATMNQMLTDATTSLRTARAVHDVLRLARVLRDSDHGRFAVGGSPAERQRQHRDDIRVALAMRSNRAGLDETHPYVKRALSMYAVRAVSPQVPPPSRPLRGWDRAGAPVLRAYRRHLAGRPTVIVPAPGAGGHSELLPGCIPKEMCPAVLREFYQPTSFVHARIYTAVAISQPAGRAGDWTARSHSVSTCLSARRWAETFEVDGVAEQFWDIASGLRGELLSESILFVDRLGELETPAAAVLDHVKIVAGLFDCSMRMVFRWLAEHWLCHPASLLTGPLAVYPTTDISPLDELVVSVWRLPLPLALEELANAADPDHPRPV